MTYALTVAVTFIVTFLVTFRFAFILGAGWGVRQHRGKCDK